MSTAEASQKRHHHEPTPMTQARWDRIATPWIVISALLPVVGTAAGKGDQPIAIVIGIACWLVFVVDLVMHMRLTPGYLRTRAGKVDLVIVLLTSPWYLFVGSSSTTLITLARVARLGRLVYIALGSGRARTMLSRIGKAGIYAGALIVACSLVVKWVEPPSSGYATYGDAFWWGCVTITTVGYGDLYPVTPVGRIAGVLLMFGGVALLGLLAGTLASFFGFSLGSPDDDPGDAPGDSSPDGSLDAADEPVAQESRG